MEIVTLKLMLLLIPLVQIQIDHRLALQYTLNLKKMKNQMDFEIDKRQRQRLKINQNQDKSKSKDKDKDKKIRCDKQLIFQKFVQNYNNQKMMDDQTNEELTEYEKFRLQKLANRQDDDNFSAHFSNVSCNISMQARSQRDIRINSFRSSDENQEDLKLTQYDTKPYQLQAMAHKYQQLENKYSELLKQYQIKQQEAEKYKILYEGELNRERETKKKLKNWVKEAKTNLNH